MTYWILNAGRARGGGLIIKKPSMHRATHQKGECINFLYFLCSAGRAAAGEEKCSVHTMERLMYRAGQNKVLVLP